MSHEQALDVIAPDGGAYLSMAAAFATYFVAGWLWWGPLFGKKWSAYMGIPMDERPNMALALGLQALGSLFLAYVLWHVMAAFTVTHTEAGDGLQMGELGMADALTGALFTWVGFFLPVQFGRVAWEKAPWGLLGINAGGHLVGLVLMSVAFALV